MRRATALLAATKYKFKHTNPMTGSWGTVATSTPKQRENNDSGEGKRVSNENNDPIVAFSRPPPLPPVFGPLLALSLLETWWSRDGDDDD